MKGKVAVIGGGIGGTLSARLFTILGYEVSIFEQSDKLGGCAGSFRRNNLTFNIGATTIGGLFSGFPVYRAFELLGVSLNENCELTISNPTMTIIREGKKIHLSPYISEWEEELCSILEVKRAYIKKLLDMTNRVLKDCLKRPFYFSLHSLKSTLKSYLTGLPLFLRYHTLYYTPASKFLKEILENSEQRVLEFFNSLTLITAQSTIDRISALTLLLSLGYVATGVGSTKNGGESLFDRLTDSVEVHLNTKVLSIRGINNNRAYLVRTAQGEEIFERLILSFPILENLSVLREDWQLYNYFKRFESMKSENSALVLYGISTESRFAPHILLITKETLSGITSGTYLISYLKQRDNLFTLTISTHTPIRWWLDSSIQSKYSYIKKFLMERIAEIVTSGLNIDTSKLRVIDLATPLTFKRHLSRMSLGGIPITMEQPISKIPPNVTPFRGLYVLNDQSLFYQGWLGLSMGLLNLYEALNDEKL